MTPPHGDHENGHVFARTADLEHLRDQLNHRIDEHAEIGAARAGALEEAEIRLEGRFAVLNGLLTTVAGEVNGVRHRLSRTDRMLELLCAKFDIVVPP